MHLVRLFVVVEKQMATTLFMNSDRNSGQRSSRFCLNIGFHIDVFEYTFIKGVFKVHTYINVESNI